MLLTDEQQDALTELINIGFARTATSLSELTGYRVFLEVPQVSIHPLHELLLNFQTLLREKLPLFNKFSPGRFLETPFYYSTMRAH